MRIGTSEGCLHDILLSSICFVLVLSMVAGENLTNYRQKNGSQDLTTQQKDGIMVTVSKTKTYNTQGVETTSS